MTAALTLSTRIAALEAQAQPLDRLRADREATAAHLARLDRQIEEGEAARRLLDELDLHARTLGIDSLQEEDEYRPAMEVLGEWAQDLALGEEVTVQGAAEATGVPWGTVKNYLPRLVREGVLERLGGTGTTGVPARFRRLPSEAEVRSAVMGLLQLRPNDDLTALGVAEEITQQGRMHLSEETAQAHLAALALAGTLHCLQDHVDVWYSVTPITPADQGGAAAD